MIFRFFEKICLVCIFLSFTAVTYTPIWNASSSEFFGFLAVFFLLLSIKIKKLNFYFDENLYILFLFLFLFLIQIYFFDFYFNENISLALMYLLGYFLCANAAKIKNKNFLQEVVWVVFFAGMFSSFIILSQYFEVNYDWMGIWMSGYDSTHGRPYANLGQPNLAATLIVTSLCCAVLFYLQNKLGFITLLLVAFFFGVVLSFPASKTSLLALGILIGISIFFRKKQVFFAFLITLIVFFIPKLFFANVRDFAATDISTGRLDMWIMMLKTIPEAPWLGYGVLNTQIAHFDNLESISRWNGQVIGSAHNLFIDFFIWGGVFFGLTATYLFFKILKNYVERNIENEEYLYLIVPIVIHSMLEYPLYYSSFLFIFCIFLNADDKSKEVAIGKKSFIFLFSILFFIFFNVCREYLRISDNYAAIRFYKNNIAGAEKPDFYFPVFLNILGTNLNVIVDNDVLDLVDYKKIEELTKRTPSFYNFKSLIYVLSERKESERLRFWMEKAKYSLVEQDYKILEEYVDSLNDI